MKVGVFFFGTVRMPDAGLAGPNPVDRRYGPAAIAEAYTDMEHWAVTADNLGYHSLWLTEHHFQHEGYEVMPNCVLTGALLAKATRQLKVGAMFNIVPQWHPIKLAEDYAIADIMTGGRVIMGVGRGTVVRESMMFGAHVGSTDWDSVGQAHVAPLADAINRAQFEEGMEVMQRAFTGEPFSFHGNYYQLPPFGVPNRGKFVDKITLVPSPINLPVEIWQPATSPATVDYVARKGFNAVFWNHGYDTTRDRWFQFGETAAKHGRELGTGGGRMLVVNIFLGSSRQAAIQRVRDGHDEFNRFLKPYGRKPGEKGTSGHSGNALATVEDSIAQRAWFVGPASQVAEELAPIVEELGVEFLTPMFHWPGISLEEVDEQMTIFKEEVVPLLEKSNARLALA